MGQFGLKSEHEIKPVTELQHSGHDYAHLQECWEALATKTGLKLETIATTPGGEPIFALETGDGCDNTIYLSAGVHGDECAPVWGLLHWAEQNTQFLNQIPILLFPCLNPEGLKENTRDDQDGHDLNRSFNDRSIPVVKAWHERIHNRRFSRCLQLHEDYDSLGNYLYELSDTPGLGRKLLEAGSLHIPTDLRPEIEDYPFDRGILHHSRADVERLVAETEFEGAEPCQLVLHHTDLCITFESPSELDLQRRIATHCQAIEAFVEDWRNHG